MGAGGHALGKEPAKTDVGYGPSEDARIRWKLDVHMMPLFFVLCMFVPLNPPLAEADGCARYDGLH